MEERRATTTIVSPSLRTPFDMRDDSPLSPDLVKENNKSNPNSNTTRKHSRTIDEELQQLRLRKSVSVESTKLQDATPFTTPELSEKVIEEERLKLKHVDKPQLFSPTRRSSSATGKVFDVQTELYLQQRMQKEEDFRKKREAALQNQKYWHKEVDNPDQGYVQPSEQVTSNTLVKNSIEVHDVSFEDKRVSFDNQQEPNFLMTSQAGEEISSKTERAVQPKSPLEDNCKATPSEKDTSAEDGVLELKKKWSQQSSYEEERCYSRLKNEEKSPQDETTITHSRIAEADGGSLPLHLRSAFDRWQKQTQRTKLRRERSYIREASQRRFELIPDEENRTITAAATTTTTKNNSNVPDGRKIQFQETSDKEEHTFSTLKNKEIEAYSPEIFPSRLVFEASERLEEQPQRLKLGHDCSNAIAATQQRQGLDLLESTYFDPEEIQTNSPIVSPTHGSLDTTPKGVSDLDSVCSELNCHEAYLTDDDDEFIRSQRAKIEVLDQLLKDQDEEIDAIDEETEQTNYEIQETMLEIWKVRNCSYGLQEKLANLTLPLAQAKANEEQMLIYSHYQLAMRDEKVTELTHSINKVKARIRRLEHAKEQTFRKLNQLQMKRDEGGKDSSMLGSGKMKKEEYQSERKTWKSMSLLQLNIQEAMPDY